VGGSSAKLLIVASLVGLAVAPPAQAKKHYLRFKVTSVKGEQTVTWHDSLAYGDCGQVTRSGSQTIAFTSTKPAKLKLLRIPRYTKSGKRRGFTYVGFNFIRSNWIFTRSFQPSPPPPGCPVDPAPAGQASDCGTQGPFAVGIDIGWRDGAVNLRGVTDPTSPQSPQYKHCDYDGFHEVDLLDSKGRLSQKRLTRRSHRPIRLKVSDKRVEPTGDAEGSQTTSLKATVTLKRVR
jgi:hypothetical protein